ncbi:MAG: 4-(cytidine 5'-diphospho)-2-C-methyl-D-erythritol kinase [Acidimicrobiia bacterium]
MGRSRPGRGVSLELLAPAKLTLSLRILGTRADGFHDLEALTVSVDVPYDALTVRPGAPGVVLEVSGPAAAGVPTGDENLAVRAARAVLPDGAGLVIGLRKQIPPGSGLGGGSSDAAAVLRVCADTYELAPAVVAATAAEIGSDVPFCLHRDPAWMRGRGEIIDPVPLPTALRVLIVVPPFPISTAAVYRAWDELGAPRHRRRLAPPAALGHLVDELANDLEPAAEHVEPRLAPFREALETAAGARALLAGSGSSCWIPFEDPEAWRAAATRVEAFLGLPAHLGMVLTADSAG